MEIVAFVVFERQTIEVFSWYSPFILLHFSESEAFSGEALVLGEISVLILLSSVWTLDLFSHLTLKISIFIGVLNCWGGPVRWPSINCQQILMDFPFCRLANEK